MDNFKYFEIITDKLDKVNVVKEYEEGSEMSNDSTGTFFGNNKYQKQKKRKLQKT